MDGIEASGEAPGYRPVSRLAVTAAVAGLASAIALTSPMLWVVPLVGVGLAVAALADVARPGAEKAGRGLALAGLALSIGFGAQAVTSAVASRWVMEDRARAVAEAWLDAIGTDRLTDAQKMLGPDVVSPEELMSHSGHEHEIDEKRTAAFLKVPAFKAIRDCGTGATRTVRGLGPDAAVANVWGVAVRLAPCDGGKSLEISLQLTPTVLKTGGKRFEQWLITKAEILP